jgi:hypothetical protein
MLGSEYPIIAFTRYEDVAVAVTDSGGSAVRREATPAPDRIASDRSPLGGRGAVGPFGIERAAGAPPVSAYGPPMRPGGEDIQGVHGVRRGDRMAESPADTKAPTSDSDT